MNFQFICIKIFIFQFHCTGLLTKIIIKANKGAARDNLHEGRSVVFIWKATLWSTFIFTLICVRSRICVRNLIIKRFKCVSSGTKSTLFSVSNEGKIALHYPLEFNLDPLNGSVDVESITQLNLIWLLNTYCVGRKISSHIRFIVTCSNSGVTQYQSMM